MPYRYERIRTANTTTELTDALAYVEREHFRTTLFMGARCYRGEVGPPQAKGRGSRWFDEETDPDQLWLPFEKFTPAKITGVYPNYHPEYGEGWVIAYMDYRRQVRELAYHVNQVEGVNRIVTLSLYKQVAVQQRPPSDPFLESYRPSRSWRGPSDNSVSVQPISRSLIGILRGAHVRNRLETEVSRMLEIQCEVSLDPVTGVFYNDDNEAVAHVADCTQTQFEPSLNFHLDIHANPGEQFTIAGMYNDRDIVRSTW
jgi:hypothetical protein